MTRKLPDVKDDGLENVQMHVYDLVLYFPALRFGPSFSYPAFSRCCYWVHHTIPTDSVPTDAIPTVHAQSGRRVADCS